MTDPWLVILVGSPIVLLISPSRPILSWQVPVVTAAVAGGDAEPVSRRFKRCGHDNGCVELVHFARCFLLPGALIFHYRDRRSRQLEKAPGVPIA